jgi:hypothetical protein
MEQLQARQQEFERHGAGQEHTQLERKIAHWCAKGRACAIAHDVHRRIMVDDKGPPQFARASQNIAATTALLWGLSHPAIPKERKTQQEIRKLLERAAEQQAESWLSRRCGLDAS